MREGPTNYFDDCGNCGKCCKLPGIFLPEQVEELARRFRLGINELFGRYLIAELYTPGAEFDPIFMLYPVKIIDEAGNRIPVFFADQEYHRLRHLQCVFRSRESMSCDIHTAKPFGCSELLCRKMINTDPVLRGKCYYYYKWLDAQQLIFDVFPAIEKIFPDLLGAAMPGKAGVREITAYINRFICREMILKEKIHAPNES